MYNNSWLWYSLGARLKKKKNKRIFSPIRHGSIPSFLSLSHSVFGPGSGLHARTHTQPDLWAYVTRIHLHGTAAAVSVCVCDQILLSETFIDFSPETKKPTDIIWPEVYYYYYYLFFSFSFYLRHKQSPTAELQPLLRRQIPTTISHVIFLHIYRQAYKTGAIGTFGQ